MTGIPEYVPLHSSFVCGEKAVLQELHESLGVTGVENFADFLRNFSRKFEHGFLTAAVGCDGAFLAFAFAGEIVAERAHVQVQNACQFLQLQHIGGALTWHCLGAACTD